MAERYLSFADVRRMLGLSADELREMMESKVLHGVILDGVIQFREAEVMRLRDSGTKGTVGAADEDMGLVFLVDEEEEEKIEGKAYDGEALVKPVEETPLAPGEEIMEPVDLSDEQRRNAELLGTDAVVRFGREVSERARADEFGDAELEEGEEILEPSEVELPETDLEAFTPRAPEPTTAGTTESEPVESELEEKPEPAIIEAEGPAEEWIPPRLEAVEGSAAVEAPEEELTFLAEDAGPTAGPVAEAGEAAEEEAPTQPPKVVEPIAPVEDELTFEEAEAEPAAEAVEEPAGEEAVEAAPEAETPEEQPAETFEVGVAPPVVSVTEGLDRAVDEEVGDREAEPVTPDIEALEQEGPSAAPEPEVPVAASAEGVPEEPVHEGVEEVAEESAAEEVPVVESHEEAPALEAEEEPVPVTEPEGEEPQLLPAGEEPAEVVEPTLEGVAAAAAVSEGMERGFEEAREEPAITDTEQPAPFEPAEEPAEEAEQVTEEKREEDVEQPEEAAVPEGAAQPEGAAPPEESAQPEGAAPPEEAAKPEEAAPPEEAAKPEETIEVFDLEETQAVEEPKEELVTLEEEAPVEAAPEAPKTAEEKSLEEEMAELFGEEGAEPSPDEAFAATGTQEDFDLSVFQQGAETEEVLPVGDESLFEVGETAAPAPVDEVAEEAPSTVEGVSRIRALTEERKAPSTVGFTAAVIIAFAAVAFTGMLLWHLFIVR